MKILLDPATGQPPANWPSVSRPRAASGDFADLLAQARPHAARPKGPPTEMPRPARPARGDDATPPPPPEQAKTPPRPDRVARDPQPSPADGELESPLAEEAVVEPAAAKGSKDEEQPQPDGSEVVGQWFASLPIAPAGTGEDAAAGEGEAVVAGPVMPGPESLDASQATGAGKLAAAAAGVEDASATASAIPLDADLLQVEATSEPPPAIPHEAPKTQPGRDPLVGGAQAGSEEASASEPAVVAAASEGSSQEQDSSDESDSAPLPMTTFAAEETDDEAATDFHLKEKPPLEAPAAPTAPRERAGVDALKPAAVETPRAEQQFAARNVDQIVTSVRGELLPRGGTMHIRLDPPQLGSLEVTVRMNDGVLSASFQTSNEEATRLLSHTLQQLKSTLEAGGVSVDRLQVQQAPAENRSSGTRDGHDGRGSHQQQSSGQDGQQFSHSEQQRREMLQRMWAKLGIGGDPLDLVA